MISEHQFASSYTSLWRNVTPLSDGYWHFENRLAKRIAAPIYSQTPKSTRAVVNELAFLAFCELQGKNADIDRFSVASAVKSMLVQAVNYVNRISSTASIDLESIDVACQREAVQLTFRLFHFFREAEKISLRPFFPGCGLLSSCEGDVIYGDCLYEIKAGDRAFRIIDLRQLLVYSALAYAKQPLPFNSIGLFNPRTGMEWKRTLDQVCMSISGLRATDTLSALVEQFSVASVSR